jgi:hypothetical protein
MSNTIKSIGWAIQLIQCEEFQNAADTDRVFALNVVRPWASTKDPGDQTVGLHEIFTIDGPDLKGEDAYRNYKDLLTPWNWNSNTNRELPLAIFGSVDGSRGSWELVGGNNLEHQAEEIQDAILPGLIKNLDSFLFQQTRHSSRSFSVDPDHVEPGEGEVNPRSPTDPEPLPLSAVSPTLGQPLDYKQSIPHVLAPLTHLPASISNYLCQMSGFITIKKADIDRFKYVACFPLWNGITPDDLVGKVNTKGNKNVTADFGEYLGIANNPDVWFISDLCEKDKAPVTSNISKDVDNPTHLKVARELVAEHVSPVSIIIDYIKFSRDTRTIDYPYPLKIENTWRTELTLFWGGGWLSHRGNLEIDVLAGDSTRRPHLFDYFSTLEDLEILFPDFNKFYTDFARHAKTKTLLYNFIEFIYDTNNDIDSVVRENLQSIFNSIKFYTDANNNKVRLSNLFPEKDSTSEVEILEGFFDTYIALYEIQLTHPVEFYSLWFNYLIRKYAKNPNSKNEPLIQKLINNIKTGLSIDVIRKSKLGILEDIILTDNILDSQDNTIQVKLSDLIISFVNSTELVEFLENKTNQPPAGTLKALITSLCSVDQLYNHLMKMTLDRFKSRNNQLNQLRNHVSDTTDTKATSLKSFLNDFREESAPGIPTGFDKGITIKLETSGNMLVGMTDDDKNTRGFAVALQSGLKLPNQDTVWVDDRSAWITDTAIADINNVTKAIDQKIKSTQVTLINNEVNEPLWVSETVGSSLQDGLRTVTVEFTGKPIVALEQEGNPGYALWTDDHDISIPSFLDYRWQVNKDYISPLRNNTLPLLGYGLDYQAVIAKINNAGGVMVDDHFRDTLFTKLKPATDFFNLAHPYPTVQYVTIYLSAQIPGSPRQLKNDTYKQKIQLDDIAFELSEETRAHHHQTIKMNRKFDENVRDDVEGVATDGSSNLILEDKNKVFNTLEVAVGNKILNITDNSWGIIQAVTEHQLTVVSLQDGNRNTFTRGDNYKIDNNHLDYLKELKPEYFHVQRVALLVPKDSFFKDFEGNKDRGEYALTLMPPLINAEFTERWLNTDIVAKENGSIQFLSDETFVSCTDKQLFDFKNEFRYLQDNINKNNPTTEDTYKESNSYNPSISALGVKTRFSDGTKNTHILTIDKTKINAGKIEVNEDGRKIFINVKISNKNDSDCPYESDHSKDRIVNVHLLPGAFVEIEIYSLIDKDYFDDKALKIQRFYEQLKSVDIFTYTYSGSNFSYAAFSPTKYWFEAAPEYKGNVYYLNNHKQLPLNIVGPNTTYRSESRLLFTTSEDKNWMTDWEKGINLQRHDWHWTGMPVEFPSSTNKISDWLAAFSHVGSYRETLTHDFNTSFDANKNWRIGTDLTDPINNGNNYDYNDKINSLILNDGPRPARFSAYVARPIVRFSKWLDRSFVGDTPLYLENDVFITAVGKLMRGIGPLNVNERLTIPALRWNTPLTSSYSAQTDSSKVIPDRSVNGHLLIFDEPIRRTDDMTRIGGIGDTIEIDLLETREYEYVDDDENTIEQTYTESGPNPIFHPAPDQDKIKSFGLESQEPFGLTYDIVNNAKVSQTAIVINPIGSMGQWWLAKVRTRRIILPETLLGSKIEKNDPEYPGEFRLNIRHEGKDNIPIDFAIDVEDTIDVSIKTVITLLRNDGSQFIINAPIYTGDRNSSKYRFLCSWHKGRWKAGGNETWRVQVLLQAQHLNKLNWKTINKITAYKQSADWDAAYTDKSVQLAEISNPPGNSINLNDTSLYHVIVSDYTEPKWLSFIGMFGTEKLQHSFDYELKFVGDNLKLEGSNKPILSGPNNISDKLSDYPLQFNILLVYETSPSISLGEINQTTGKLVSTYLYVTNGQYFKPLRFQGATKTTTQEIEEYAYLLTFQLINVNGDVNLDTTLNEWEDVIKHIFGDEDFNIDPTTRESLIRPVPQYLGPIKILKKINKVN